MREPASEFAARLRARFPEASVELAQPRGEVGIVFDAAAHFDGCRALRDELGGLDRVVVNAQRLAA